MTDAKTSEENPSTDAPPAKRAKSVASATAAKPSSSALERARTPRRSVPEGRGAFKAIAWNVAGLRSFADKNPDALRKMIEREAPDAIVLQEHKLQESHVAQFAERLRKMCPGYDTTRFAVSRVKKGYSGIVVISREGRKGGQATLEQALGKAEGTSDDGARRQRAVSVEEGLGNGTYVDEGRTMTIEYEKFYLVAAYVPNSGQDLKRLDYRIKEWERDMRAHLKKLDAKKPVVYIGDLNVAHLDIDIWNVTAPHVKKSAGTTPQEREAFGLMLSENNLCDAFRFFHGDATGCFSYWSVRAGNRPFNKGLRLDYAVASKRIFENGGCDGVEVIDAFILDDVVGSDHAPVGITLAFD